MVGKRRRRTVAVILGVFLLAGAVWAWSVWVRVYKDVPDDPTREPAVEITPHVTNILIVGVDSLDGETGRADSIIVMSINERTSEVALVSIPRDSYVTIPGRNKDKINHAMSFGGIGLMRTTVEALLGVQMDYYIYTHIDGFQNIVDAIGGVTLNVERTISFTDPTTNQSMILQPGRQHLNSAQALAYVRFRKDHEGDFGRMRRQQQLLVAVADQVLHPGSVFRLPQLLEQISRFLRTDMRISKAIRFSGTIVRLNFDEVATIQLKGEPFSLNRISYVSLDPDFLADTINRYLRWEG